MSDSLKKWVIRSFVHFWWATWAIHWDRSFLLSNLSQSLTVAYLSWATWAIGSLQGWEFAHRFSKQIACFLPKNEWMSNLLKKTSDSLICSFLVRDLINSLTIAHFLWVTWANHSWSLTFSEQPERFAHIVPFWWVTWAIHSHHSPKKRVWAIRSFFK